MIESLPEPFEFVIENDPTVDRVRVAVRDTRVDDNDPRNGMLILSTMESERFAFRGPFMKWRNARAIYRVQQRSLRSFNARAAALYARHGWNLV